MTNLFYPNHKRNWHTRIIAAAVLIGIAISAAVADGQSTSASHSYRAKSIANFRVDLRARVESEIQKPSPIGSKMYLQPVSNWLEQDLSWQAMRAVVSVSQDGSAEIEEKLSDFSQKVSSSDDTDENKKLLADLASALNKWNIPRTLLYRETRSGQIIGLTAESAPPIGEYAPRVLTAWLLRALRPTAALPAQPLALGGHWQEPRVVQFTEWTGTAGSESGEWLALPAGIRQRGEPTVKLQTTQEITGVVTSGAEKPAEGSATAHFHAESLSTLALDDLRLMFAARSATRDILWTLAPVEGLEKPPQYRGRLFVEISIQVCDESPCSMVNGSSGGGDR
jgi:hypothetical protein